MTSGLEGVVAAETDLSHTDQKNGMVRVRGHDLCRPWWRGSDSRAPLPCCGKVFAGTGLSAESIRSLFGAARVQAFAGLDPWLTQAARRPLFEGVRLGLAGMPDTATPAELVGALTVALPALLRAANGLAPVPPS